MTRVRSRWHRSAGTDRPVATAVLQAAAGVAAPEGPQDIAGGALGIDGDAEPGAGSPDLSCTCRRGFAVLVRDLRW